MVIFIQYITCNKELTNHEGTKNTKEEKEEEEELRGKNDAFNALFEDGDIKIDEKTKGTISHF